MSKENQEVQETKPKYTIDELSNKNKDYIFRLRKILINDYSYSNDQVQDYINSILDKLVEGQRVGKTANHLFGSPSNLAKSLITKVKQQPTNNFWIISLDYAVVFVAFFTTMYAITYFTTANKAKIPHQGIVSVLLLAFGLSLPFAYFNQWIAKPKEKRGSIWMLILIFGGGIVAMLLFVGLSSIIPTVLNPAFDGIVNLIIAAAMFMTHFYLKRKFNIQGTLF